MRHPAVETGVGGLSGMTESWGREVDAPGEGMMAEPVDGSFMVPLSVGVDVGDSAPVAFGLKVHSPSKVSDSSALKGIWTSFVLRWLCDDFGRSKGDCMRGFLFALSGSEMKCQLEYRRAADPHTYSNLHILFS